MIIKEAIILAGGLGTRLRSAVPNLPKCLAPINEKPFIYYVINYFQQQGIHKFIFSLGYKHQLIINYLQNEYAHLPMQYAIENEPLGTGGAIQLACTKTTEQNVLVLNGDTLFKIQVAQLAHIHNLHKANCTLALKPIKNSNRYGAVKLADNNKIKSFKEKEFYKEALINGGVYLLNIPAFLKENWPPIFSFEKDYLEKKTAQNAFYGAIQDEYFIDIGIPEDFERANTESRDAWPCV